MKACRYFMVIGLLVTVSERSFSQEIWTIGPMLHVNFGGGEKRSTSFAIEAAYWNAIKFPYSVDFAVEFDRGRVRLYSEAQTGIGLTGLSLGPVVEFANNGTRLGVQGSCWANYFLGVDYRIRFIDKKRFHAVGLYAKLPLATAGLSDGSHHSSTWTHFDDWD